MIKIQDANDKSDDLSSNGPNLMSSSRCVMTLRSDEDSIMQQPSDSLNENTFSSNENKVIFCALWQAGFLGAAYFTYPESELYILSDTLDLKPDYIFTKNLYHQIKPTHTITLGKIDSQFLTALVHIAQKLDIDESEIVTEKSTKLTTLPYNIELLKKEKYSYDVCVHQVKNVKLSCEPPNLSDEERNLFVRSLVNFEKRISIHALGALLIYLKNNASIIMPDKMMQNYLFLNLSSITLKDIVLINDDLIENLNIYKTTMHPAGNRVYNKEGFSIFELFNNCKSPEGTTHLRCLLLRPTNNMRILKKRQNFIEFCMQPTNQGIVVGIEDCLKNIFSIGTTLNKIHRNLDTINNWKMLHSTLHNILYIKQICEPYTKQIPIFKEFESDVSSTIDLMRKIIKDTIDFENSARFKISVKIGVNENLDKKKRYQNELKEKLDLAASFEINNLPSYIKDCSIIYIPKIGYFVAIKKWGPTAHYSEIETYGYRHMFTLGNVFNFKSSVCDELDKSLGDIYTQIEEMETNIIDQLGQKILENNSVLKKPMKHIALIDSLICIAKVGKQLGYICPKLVPENIIQIEDGIHPLLDLTATNFIPNSFISGGENSLIKIITGPNNSGKSIYLRQTALIVYLAHIGSFVPAKSATIGMMHSIQSSMSDDSANEIVTNMSTFMKSLKQMSQASSTAFKNSLIIIDEFGRATTELDGQALLTSFLEHYLLRKELCPHILVSTHFNRITQFIPESKYVEHLKCDYKFIENNDKIIFLYKIVKGVSKSFAKYAAINSGISVGIIKRSEEILKCLQEGQFLEPRTDF